MIDLLSTVMNAKSKRKERKDNLSCIHCRFYTDYDNGHMQGECGLAPFPDDTYGYNSACSKGRGESINMDYVGWAALFFSCIVMCVAVPVVGFISFGFWPGLVGSLVLFGPAVGCVIQMMDAIRRI